MSALQERLDVMLPTVRCLAKARLPTEHGTFTVLVYGEQASAVEHVVMTLGQVGGDDVLVRVHSECLTGDVLGSQRCDCGAQLRRAQALIGGEGRGILIYMRGHEGRGIGLAAKLQAYVLQDAGADTLEANELLGLPADARCFEAAAQILRDLGVQSIRLMTNNPVKVATLAGKGIAIRERVPLSVAPTPESKAYLQTKRVRFGHLLDL
jgi:3,4-dihydroxy 2-butanone 4-phosphate synthase/GTP cyclohydrolase II